MAHIENALIFAVLCILAGSLTQASGSEHGSPHIHHKVPLDPSDAEGRPPHIHGVAPLLPPGIVGRPPHHSSEEAPLDLSDAEVQPPHIHDDAPSDAEGRPPHFQDETSLAPSDAEHRSSHIHEEASLVPNDKQYDSPDWIPLSPGVNWTPCDIHAGPRVRCHDCDSRLICTRVGGFVIDCPDDNEYCRNGLCSDVPIAGCV